MDTFYGFTNAGDYRTIARAFFLLGGACGALLSCWLIGVAIYRLYFHPLAKYPGPWYMKISSWYDFYIAYNEHRHLHFAYLHEKYGPIVRYGPNDLAFNTPTAFEDMYGFKANVRKADATTAAASSNPETTSTFSEPDRQRALKKRKILSQGFSESALRSAESFMIDQIEILCKQLVNPSTEKVKDLSLWLNYLAYDIMGEVVFGKRFNMMTDSSMHYVLPLIDSMVFGTLLGGCMPWLYKLGLIDVIFPSLFSMRKQFISYVGGVVEERIVQTEKDEVGDRKDFFYHLLKAQDADTGKPLSRATLFTEGVLLVVGGSDTSSTGLAATVFYLLQNPLCMERLYKELTETFDNVDEIRSGGKLARCLYLRACVEEALRMAPPGPGILPRTILEGGQVIDGEFLPAGTNVGVGWWALAYNKQTFPEPHKFQPERYIVEGGRSEEEVQRAKSGYWAFSLGPRKCPGTKMAYQELYITIARLVYLFEIKPEKPEELKDNFKLLDHFNVKKSGPFVSFRLRDGQAV